jgi:membrane protease YdiL (CAAX protease family)
MSSLVRDAEGRLRNGVWILLFVLVFLASRALYRGLAEGLRALGASELLMPALAAGCALLVTWVCVRLRRQPLASVGLGLNRAWAWQFGLGSLLGGASAALAVGLLWFTDAARLELDPSRGLEALVIGLYLFAAVAVLEELLFRGFAFQRLVGGIGFWPAQVSMGLLFAIGHWGNPGMSGTIQIVATVEIALGAVLLGLAWQRSQSLALPIGLHLGWNWVQGQIFGFAVSGTGQAGWLQPQLNPDAPLWLSGGGFGLEASLWAVATDLAMIALLWHWPREWRSAPTTAVASAPATEDEQPAAEEAKSDVSAPAHS